MSTIKILVVDDEILIAEDLMDILISLGFPNIELAHDKTEAIAKLKSFSPDIALLDIRMEKELDGLEIGEFINNSGSKIPFIYITAHSDVAMIKQIVKTKPAGYINKPFKKSDLFAAINLAANKLDEKKLVIKDGYKNLIIDFNDVIYIESEGNYINIFCTNQKIVSRQAIDGFINGLDESIFLRIHRSYIVNLKKITKFSRKEVYIGSTILPIARSYIQTVEERMKDLN